MYRERQHQSWEKRKIWHNAMCRSDNTQTKPNGTWHIMMCHQKRISTNYGRGTPSKRNQPFRRIETTKPARGSAQTNLVALKINHIPKRNKIKTTHHAATAKAWSTKYPEENQGMSPNILMEHHLQKDATESRGKMEMYRSFDCVAWFFMGGEVIGSAQDDTEISLVSRCQQRKICFLTSCWHLPEHLPASFWCNWYWSTRDHQRGGLDDGLLVVAGLLCCFFWLFCLLLRGVTWIGLCAYPYICVFRRKFLQGMRIRISAVKYEFLCRFRSFWILFDSSARVQTLGLQKSRSSVWKDFSVQDFFSFYVNNTGYLPIIPTIRCLRQECSCEFSKH